MALISLAQYAERYGKDGGNLRRLIAQGRIPAQKIGSQWAIEETTPWPQDNRIKSGKYRNWRKKQDSHGEPSP